MITNAITQIRDKTTKNKDQPTNNHKKNKKTTTTKKTKKTKKKQKNRKIINKRNVKAMGKITPPMDHYPRNG